MKKQKLPYAAKIALSMEICFSLLSCCFFSPGLLYLTCLLQPYQLELNISFLARVRFQLTMTLCTYGKSTNLVAHYGSCYCWCQSRKCWQIQGRHHPVSCSQWTACWWADKWLFAWTWAVHDKESDSVPKCPIIKNTMCELSAVPWIEIVKLSKRVEEGSMLQFMA